MASEMRIRAVRVHETGGPDILRYEEVVLPEPGPGEVRVRHRAVGFNFIDIYYRTGLYKARLPHGLGMEAAGVIEHLGPDVTGFSVGDRVGHTMVLGAAAEAANIPVARLVKLPAGISEELAAAVLLKGMTAEYLLCRTYPVKRGETILFYAAAGAVGAVACPWAKALGATVIGVVGSEAKVAEAAAHGCDHVLVMGKDDIVARVRALTGGKGVPVVYDSVGRDTFQTSLDCLARRGVLASFGNASGPVGPISIDAIAKGAYYVTRPGLAHYAGTRAELELSASALFDILRSGAVKVEIRQRYALGDVAQAHRDLEGRKTTGASIFIP
jgi:NADPH2:quinone reductase